MTSASPKDAPKAPRSPGPPAESPLAAIHFANLVTEELVRLLEDGQRELTARRERERAEFLARIVEEAAAIGIDASEVVRAFSRLGRRPRADGRADVKPKYRNPADPSQTWSGRGACPKWLQAFVDGGADLESFRVPEKQG
jgi:DNA-binding protein H-NS